MSFRLKRWTWFSRYFLCHSLPFSKNVILFYGKLLWRRCHLYDTYFDRVLLKFESHFEENWLFSQWEWWRERERYFHGLQLKLIVNLKTSKSIRISSRLQAHEPWRHTLQFGIAHLWALAPSAKKIRQTCSCKNTFLRSPSSKCVQLFNFVFVHLFFGWWCKWLTVKSSSSLRYRGSKRNME